MHQGGAEIVDLSGAPVDLAALHRLHPAAFEAHICELFDLQLRGMERKVGRLPVVAFGGERRIAAL